MRKKMINVGDNKIAIYDSEGEGQDVFLIHGNSLSSKSFINQLEGFLAERFHIIAIDLPGHGESLPAVDPQNIYSVTGYAEVIIDIISQLNLSKIVLVGHSLGGHIALELSEMSSEVIGILIFGTPPLGRPPAFNQAFLPNPGSRLGFKKRFKEDDIRLFASGTIKQGADIPQIYLDDISTTDPNARYYLGRNMGGNQFKDEIEIISKMKIPLAVIHGAHDQAINLDYIKKLDMPSLWKNEVQVINNAGHSPQWETPDEFNSILAEFLKEAI